LGIIGREISRCFSEKGKVREAKFLGRSQGGGKNQLVLFTGKKEYDWDVFQRGIKPLLEEKRSREKIIINRERVYASLMKGTLNRRTFVPRKEFVQKEQPLSREKKKNKKNASWRRKNEQKERHRGAYLSLLGRKRGKGKPYAII